MSHLVRSAAAAVTGAAVLVGPLTSCSIFGERFEPQGAKASAARALQLFIVRVTTRYYAIPN